MSQARLLAASVALLATTFTAVPAKAAFHLWYIQEIFSNYDGSVQFIELRATANGQNLLNGHTITTGSHTFTFNANAPSSTTNTKTLLLATAGFGSIPGAVAPNYSSIPLPANFFNPAGDTITFAEGADTKTFTSLPVDGINSFNYATYSAVPPTTAVNSPRNFNGLQGSVNLPPPANPDPTGDYNQDGTVDAADYVHWRKTFGDPASPAGSGADGDESGQIGDGDYDYWYARFGVVLAGASSEPIPEPATIVLSLVAFGILGIRRRSYC
jgi:hypothetical protein